MRELSGASAAKNPPEPSDETSSTDEIRASSSGLAVSRLIVSWISRAPARRRHDAFSRSPSGSDSTTSHPRRDASQPASIRGRGAMPRLPPGIGR